MKIAIGAIAVVASALASSAMAYVNILPGSGATVTGSSIHDGFNATIAAGNLINETTNPAYENGDYRWVFADGGSPSTPDQTLIVDLGSAKTIDEIGFAYEGQDRIPTNFSVLISNDGVGFVLAAGPSPTQPDDYGIPGIYTTGFGFNNITAKYVEYDFGKDSIGGYGGGGGVGQGLGVNFLFIGSPTPEPAAWALMLVGFAGLGAALRRRQAIASTV